MWFLVDARFRKWYVEFDCLFDVCDTSISLEGQKRGGGELMNTCVRLLKLSLRDIERKTRASDSILIHLAQ